MTTDTEVKPMTAADAEEIFVGFPDSLPYRIFERIGRIATRDHEVIDKATHAAVEHAELERLRACEADSRRLDYAERSIHHIEKWEADGIRHWWEVQPIRSDGFVSSDDAVTATTLRAAIDAAQQEES